MKTVMIAARLRAGILIAVGLLWLGGCAAEPTSRARVYAWLDKLPMACWCGGSWAPADCPPWEVWDAEGRAIPGAKGIVEEALRTADPRVRPYQAARALGLLGDRDSVPVLLRLLDSPSSDIRKVAAVSLGYLGGDDAIDALAVLVREDPVKTVRGSAAMVLVDLSRRRRDESERALQAAAYALDDEDPGVRDAFWSAFVEEAGGAEGTE